MSSARVPDDDAISERGIAVSDGRDRGSAHHAGHRLLSAVPDNAAPDKPTGLAAASAAALPRDPVATGADAIAADLGGATRQTAASDGRRRDSRLAARDRGTAAPQAESLGDLVRRLVDDIILLVRSELRLARSEIQHNVVKASSSVAAIAAGAMMVSIAMLCLLGAAVALLAQSVGIVAAAAIVAVVAIIAGGLLIALGIRRLQQVDLAPVRMVANLRRDAEALTGD
jgi:hypothetical protein